MDETNKNLFAGETRTEIEGTTYIVKSFFDASSRETAETKLRRLIAKWVAADVKNGNCMEATESLD
jgi:hypothetical protein